VIANNIYVIAIFIVMSSFEGEAFIICSSR
jgi:hypothetical protein